jgi:hypothetical protein
MAEDAVIGPYAILAKALPIMHAPLMTLRYEQLQ